MQEASYANSTSPEYLTKEKVSDPEENPTYCFLFSQIYSLTNKNDSLIVEDLGKRNTNNLFACINGFLLGTWDSVNKTNNLRNFKTVEQRLNMNKFPITFGTKNSSQKLLNTIDENVIEDDNDESNLIEILDYIISFLNATLLLVLIN